MTDMGSAYTQANAAYAQANTARSDANTTFATINTTFGTVNTSLGTVNTSLGTINTNYQAAYAQANTARGTANDSYAQANAAYGQANTARSDANTTFGTINTTFGTVNTSLGTINTNYQAAYAQANTARTTANDAYATANTKLGTSGGSISGDLTISGNLVVQGNATTINVSSLSVNDSIILLSSNSSGDAEDIGFVGHITRDSTNTHVGLIRKATENRFYLFDNYEVEPTNNTIDITGNNFRVGNIRLGTINANSFVTAAGLDVTGQANAAYSQANAAYGQANTARSDANTTFATVNTTFGTINTSLGTINTNYQAAYSQANAAYGQANAAYGQANSAYGAANNRVLKAGDTMTGQLNISAGGLLVTGNVGIGTTNPQNLFHVSGSSQNVRFSNFSTDSAGLLISYQNSSTHGLHLMYRPNDATCYIDSTYQATSGTVYGDLIFRQNVAGTMTPRITIKADGGNVGIGTNNPQGKLTISNAGAEGIEFFATGGVGGGPYLNAYNRSVGRYVPFTYYANTHTFYTNTGSTRALDISTGGSVGIGTNSSSYKLHIQEGGITAAAISTGWPAYNAENATQSKIILYLSAGNNGSVATAGQGGSAVLMLGDYFDSRGIITMIGAGGSSPSDAGTGYGKDLMVKGGNSDNGNGFVGGRLFLAGGSGYSGGAYGSNYGAVILQPQGGNVGIGTTSPTEKLHVDGSIRLNNTLTVNASYASLNQNAYFSGGWKKYASGYARRVEFGAGGYYYSVSNAAGGSAGDGITWTDLLTITDAGNVGIGTTSPGSSTKLFVNGQSTLKRLQKQVYNWYTTSGSSYVHFKTTLKLTGTGYHVGMWSWRFYGYSYGTAKIIDSYFGLHGDSSGTIYSAAYQDQGEVAFCTNMYKSSDNFLVIVGLIDNTYFFGLDVDVHHTMDYAYMELGISAVSQSANTSGVY
jgi:hypothetical protein